MQCTCVVSYHLVGVSEFAELCGVSRQAVDNWQKRHTTFPKPVARLAIGPLWLVWQVRYWQIYHQPKRRR